MTGSQYLLSDERGHSSYFSLLVYGLLVLTIAFALGVMGV